MYGTPYQRGSIHIHERLLHNLVLGEEIYQISNSTKTSVNKRLFMSLLFYVGKRRHAVIAAFAGAKIRRYLYMRKRFSVFRQRGAGLYPT